MATYSNQPWLLSHIRNSFVSTDDTGICETVMRSDDLPKQFARKFQTDPYSPTSGHHHYQQHHHQHPHHQHQHPPHHHHHHHHRKSINTNGGSKAQFVDRPLQEADFICYPGLDHSDDEDVDLSSQSFDIQMFPEMGAHRFRSNTAQKLEKMNIARRKAARTKCVNYDDEIMPPEQSDFFVRKPVGQLKTPNKKKTAATEESELSKAVKDNSDFLEDTGIKSKLTVELANSPKQAQNKFMEYARFDGTSQTGIQTKRINVFLNMLPERERNYPIKICVLAHAKIQEVIGLVCYKATIQFPDIPLKSIRHYALYMTEDNDDMDDFPPLDSREPCSKFGFSHLTLAERRPLVPVTRFDYNSVLTTSEDKARLGGAAVKSLQNNNQSNGGQSDEKVGGEFLKSQKEENTINDEYDTTTLSHNDMLEAPIYRTYRINIIDKRFFKTEVTLGVSGERIEIDQQKNAKFWSKQKAVTYPMDSVANVEIVERRNTKATLRIYLKVSTGSSTSGCSVGDAKSLSGGNSTGNPPHSPTSPGHSSQLASSPFSFFSSSIGNANGQHHHHQHHMRFKHYDFEAPTETIEHILNKLNCILEVRSSEARREFLHARERKLEKQSKKHLKL